MLKALIVENNNTFRQYLKNILCSQTPPLIVGEASKEEDILSRIGTFHPDIVFLNIKWQAASGLDLTKKIKGLHPEIRIIILTGYDLPEYREAAYQYGADYFLSKMTLTEDDISNLVQSIFSRVGHNSWKVKGN